MCGNNSFLFACILIHSALDMKSVLILLLGISILTFEETLKTAEDILQEMMVHI